MTSAKPPASTLLDAARAILPDVLDVRRRLQAFLGARPADEDPATAPMLHSNRVVFDEDALAVGVATYVAVALRHLTSG